MKANELPTSRTLVENKIFEQFIRNSLTITSGTREESTADDGNPYFEGKDYDSVHPELK